MRKLSGLITFTCILLFASKVDAQISVTATAGTVGPTLYTTLNAAVNAINAGTHQGVINVSVTANTTESVQSVLNSSGTGSSSYTSITLKPAPSVTPTISGTISSNSILQLNGADNVTIDGSNTIGGTTRDLTITNNSTAGTETVIWIASASSADGATNNIIKNCRLTGFSAGTTVAGILTGSTTLGGAALAANSNNSIQNNLFSNVQNGVYLYGYTAAPYDVNWNISGNSFVTLGFRGMILQNAGSFTISNNTISGVSANTTSVVTGIQLSSAYAGGNIFNNSVSNVNNTAATYGCNGIFLNATTTASNINIYNNFVYNVWSTSGWTGGTGSGDNGYGIIIAQGGGYNLYHNTIQLITNSAAGLASAAINITSAVTSASSINLRDNIIVNSQTSGSTRYGIYCTAVSSIFASIDYNDYYSVSGNLGRIGGTNRTTIAAMTTGFGGNTNSITYNPVFVSTSDLHLQTIAANNVLATGTPITSPSITTDIDGTTRSTTAPTIGADELITNTITYTLLPSTACVGDVALNGVTVASSTGIPTSGTTVPQVYFRKNAGTWFHSSGTLASGTGTSGTWNFTISAATMGGVAAADVISYYIVAQTTGGSVFSTPSTGLVATDVNTVTTAPTTPNTYTVTGVPTAVSATPSGTALCVGNTLTLTGAATGATSYSWTGPNSYTSAVLTPASFTVGTASAGIYTLVATNACGSTTVTTSAITVTAPPTALLATPSATTLCSGDVLTLTGAATGATSYGWSGPASYSAAVLNPPSFVVSTASSGIYSFTATNSCGSATTNTGTITVLTLPTTVSAAASATSICLGSTLTITGTATGATSYSWAGPGSYSAAVLNPPSFVTTAASAGIYTLTATNMCGNTTATTASVTILTVPSAVTAALSATPLCAGNALTLTGSATGATSYSWSGPDSYSAAVLNPPAITTSTLSAGIYTLTATNACGNTTATTASLVVNTAPTAVTATANPTTLCAGDALTLTGGATSTIPVSYGWAGPGSYSAAMQNPPAITATTASGGVYTLTATNACGNTTATTATVTINTVPTAVTAIPFDTTLCDGDVLTLTGTATSPITTTYSWAGPDSYSSTDLNPAGFTTTTLSAGVYTLTATNTCGNTTATTAAIIINTVPSSVTATASAAALCAGNTLTLTGVVTNATSYLWNGPNSYSSSSLNPAAITTTTLSSGIYTLTATNGCGSVSDTTAYVTVNATPTAVTATAAPTPLCSGSTLTLTGTATSPIATTYSWAGPGSYSSTDLNPAGFVAATTSAGVYTLTATNSCGSTTAMTASVVVRTVPTGVTATAAPTTLCSGSTLSLTGTSTSPITTTYSWSGPNSYSSTNLNPAGIITSTLSAGIYTLTATNICGSSIDTTASVIVNRTPTAVTATASPASVCSGATLTLTGTATSPITATYSWSGPGGYSSTSLNPAGFVTTPTSGGIYTLTATNVCGNTTATTSSVVVVTAPTSVTAGIVAASLCAGTSMSLVGTATNATSYNWSGPAGYNSTLLNPPAFTASVASSGTYTLSAGNSCFTITATASIVIAPLPPMGPITGNTTICAGGVSNLSDTVSGGVWSSANPTIATVNGAGMVSGVNAGTTTISYTNTNTCGTALATATVTIIPIPTFVPVTGSSMLCQGSASLYLNALTGGTWASNNPMVATIDASSGMATGVMPGTAIISYTVNNGCGAPVTDTITVNVITAPDAGNIFGPIRLCMSDTIRLHNYTTGGTWYVVNSHASITSTGGLITGNTSGVDTAYYVVSNMCGTDTTRFPFYVYTAMECSTAAGVGSVDVNNFSCTVYPNPNTGTFTLSGTWIESDNAATIEILDLLGQVVYKRNISISNGKIDEQVQLGSNLSAGMYMLRINSANAQQAIRFTTSQ